MKRKINKTYVELVAYALFIILFNAYFIGLFFLPFNETKQIALWSTIGLISTDLVLMIIAVEPIFSHPKKVTIRSILTPAEKIIIKVIINSCIIAILVAIQLLNFNKKNALFIINAEVIVIIGGLASLPASRMFGVLVSSIQQYKNFIPQNNPETDMKTLTLIGSFTIQIIILWIIIWYKLSVYYINLIS